MTVNTTSLVVTVPVPVIKDVETPQVVVFVLMTEQARTVVVITGPGTVDMVLVVVVESECDVDTPVEVRVGEEIHCVVWAMVVESE